jgi:hypothetical protein
MYVLCVLGFVRALILIYCDDNVYCYGERHDDGRYNGDNDNN